MVSKYQIEIIRPFEKYRMKNIIGWNTGEYVSSARSELYLPYIS